DGTNIYIYDVTDQRLDGIKAVTAAHEMLHAAYARLSDADKQRIDSLLESEYDKLKDNRNFTERMAFYARTEPGERSNELHSVIGTEVSDIGSELEQYYSRYFKDRQVVVQLHDGYSKVFTDLQDRANQLVKQLDTLSAAIKSDSAKYNTMVADLNKAISDFNARTQNNEFSSQSEFAQERAVLLQRADQLDQMRNDINASIARYDALQTQLESVSSQSDALNRSIDSSLAPAPTV
ncbi:MAG: hypothetical protein ABIR91_02400, partial [Candidatus Saccharimonadales bacterium]